MSLCTLPDTELLGVVAERPEGHAQQFGGASLHSAGLLEGLEHVAALQVIEGAVEVETAGRQRRRCGELDCG